MSQARLWTEVAVVPQAAAEVDIPAAIAAAGSVGSAVAALATVTFVVVTAARRPTTVDRLLELDAHIDARRHPTLGRAIDVEITMHAAELLARRRIRHPLILEIALWGIAALFLALSASSSASADTASLTRAVAYSVVGILVLITVVVEAARFLERRKLLR